MPLPTESANALWSSAVASRIATGTRYRSPVPVPFVPGRLNLIAGLSGPR